MTTTKTFTEAVRTALAYAPPDDMRRVARQAVALMSQDLVLEAAITHLAGLARRLHNDQLRAHGHPSPLSDEVVNVHGVDMTLGATTDSDREYLIANRETLAAGLRRRAQQIREYGAAGYTAAARRFTSREVLGAESQADRLQRMVRLLSDLCERDDSGLTLAAREAAQELRDIAAERRLVEADITEMSDVAARLVGCEVGPGVWPRTRRALHRLSVISGKVAA